jgi:hypothetical protein
MCADDGTPQIYDPGDDFFFRRGKKQCPGLRWLIGLTLWRMRRHRVVQRQCDKYGGAGERGGAKINDNPRPKIKYRPKIRSLGSCNPRKPTHPRDLRYGTGRRRLPQPSLSTHATRAHLLGRCKGEGGPARAMSSLFRRKDKEATARAVDNGRGSVYKQSSDWHMDVSAHGTGQQGTDSAHHF